MKKLKESATTLCLVAATILPGCMTLGVGESSYSCQGLPQGVRCMSARDIYTATNNADHVGPTGPNGAKPAAQDTPAQLALQKTLTGAFPRSVEDLTPITEAAVPVRSPAKVIRTWIAPWEDDEGYLHASEYVFAEVEGRRWSIGNQTFGDSSSLSKPLKTGMGVSGKDRAVSPLRGSSPQSPAGAKR
jgi:conjugal transfer pilus assembly protein TraV